MPDYARLYRHMWGATTDVIELLKKAQQEAEEMYVVDSSDPELKLFPGSAGDDGED